MNVIDLQIIVQNRLTMSVHMCKLTGVTILMAILVRVQRTKSILKVFIYEI